MKILLATQNKGKVKEIKGLFANDKLNLISLDKYDISEPEENGTSFEENALLKAKYYYQKTLIDCISDDSGICIPALGGAPGIYSARWAGEKRDFSIAIDKIYRLLKDKNIDVLNSKVDAYFYCAIAYVGKGFKSQIFCGRIDGSLKFPPAGDNGFGYDPIFIPKGKNMTFGEMLYSEKMVDNHRVRAFLRLKPRIIKKIVA